jgi:glycosyltransferase involved in cell wall biosynthesis
VKILMAISHYYPTPGGSERQAHLLARGLRDRGHEVRVLTMRLGPGPSKNLIEGIPVHRAIRGIQRGPVFGFSYLLTGTAAMARLGRRADVLHAHHLYLDAVTATVVGRLVRVPALAKVACGGAVGDLSRLRRMAGGGILLRILRGLDRVIAPSHETETEVRRAGFPPGRIVRIPNSVDVTRFMPGEIRHNGTEARTVIFLGRLEPQKGVDTLLQAWAEVAPQLPGAHLRIAGDGSQVIALRALATQLGLASRVEFLGVVPDPERHLRQASVFVLPSWHEGLPNALLEAMATGLPCVATAIGGTVDVARDERDALLVPPGDSAALAKALLRILTDSDLAGRLGTAARLRVVADFSLDAMVARYEQLYREMRDAA